VALIKQGAESIV